MERGTSNPRRRPRATVLEIQAKLVMEEPLLTTTHVSSEQGDDTYLSFPWVDLGEGCHAVDLNEVVDKAIQASDAKKPTSVKKRDHLVSYLYRICTKPGRMSLERIVRSGARLNKDDYILNETGVISCGAQLCESACEDITKNMVQQMRQADWRKMYDGLGGPARKKCQQEVIKVLEDLPNTSAARMVKPSVQTRQRTEHKTKLGSMLADAKRFFQLRKVFGEGIFLFMSKTVDSDLHHMGVDPYDIMNHVTMQLPLLLDIVERARVLYLVPLQQGKAVKHMPFFMSMEEDTDRRKFSFQKNILPLEAEHSTTSATILFDHVAPNTLDRSCEGPSCVQVVPPTPPTTLFKSIEPATLYYCPAASSMSSADGSQEVLCIETNDGEGEQERQGYRQSALEESDSRAMDLDEHEQPPHGVIGALRWKQADQDELIDALHKARAEVARRHAQEAAEHVSRAARTQEGKETVIEGIDGVLDHIDNLIRENRIWCLPCK
ncbi:hypothetical protein LTR17_024470 [Elasticomyces elasticus]|nr:hypothetical protein LTR17_024470 [Elasticomyces elasticus]